MSPVPRGAHDSPKSAPNDVREASLVGDSGIDDLGGVAELADAKVADEFGLRELRSAGDEGGGWLA